MNDEITNIDGKFYKESDVVTLNSNDGKIITKDLYTKHLYFLSNDEIRLNDWYYTGARTSEYGIHQANTERLVHIARDAQADKSIICKKVIVSTDESLGLPRPSDDFLKKYCELGGIDKVLVEYDTFKRVESSDNYLDDVIILNDTFKYKVIDKDEDFNLFPILKVSPDNTITIKPFKVKDSWNREELEKLLHMCWIQATRKIHEPLTELGFSAWMKENIK